jgi:hypothetical protein
MNDIKEYRVISNYVCETSVRKAEVVKEVGTKRFIVRMMNDSGSYFTAIFTNIDEAEDFAESWVLNK